MTSPRLVVVTVNYCCAEVILEGIDETLRQLDALGDAALWIIDNQSPDGSAETLRTALADKAHTHLVQVIDAGANGGFGAGNNVGIRAALAQETPPEYIYFLNPDAVPEPGAIETLVGFMDSHPDTGIAGSLLTDETGTFQASLYRFPSFLSEIETALRLGLTRRLLHKHRVLLPTPQTATSVDWVSGASFIARSAALQQAGPFDETFFLYWEEIELCHRVRKAGYDIHAVPEAVVFHSEGVSTGMSAAENRVPPYWYASRNHFFRSTGRGGNIGVLNAAVAVGLVLQRLHLGLRGRALTPPHFLKDFVKYSLYTPKDPRSNPDARYSKLKASPE